MNARRLRLVDDDVLTEREAEIALAVATTSSYTEAARVVSCDRRTVARNAEKPVVAREVARLRRGMLDFAAQKLCALSGKAVGTLEKILDDDDAPAASRVAACREVLSRAESMKADADTLERLERLEREAQRRGVR